jgi:Zn-finger nucleic acid-binding protein
MHRRNYRKCSGVILDRCAEHGTWLDADELEQIAGFILEKGGVPPEPNLEPRPVPRHRAEYTRTVAFTSTRELDRSVAGSVLGLLASLLD